MILEPYSIEIIDKRKCREFKYNNIQRVSDFTSSDGTKWTRVQFEDGWWYHEYGRGLTIHTGTITESGKYVFLVSENERYYA